MTAHLRCSWDTSAACDPYLRLSIVFVRSSVMDGGSLSKVAHADDGDPDIHSTAGKIADLERRRHEAVHAGSAAAVEKQHARGKLTARERIALLLDEGSFTEFDQLARHRAHEFGIQG